MKDRARKVAKSRGLDFDENQFPLDYHHTSAFQHKDLPAVTDREPNRIQPLRWGLIPFWVKDSAGAKTIENNTPNAMGETIFSKPAFRQAAKTNRCLIVVDGFYEYHHVSKTQKVPYYITSPDEFLIFAGLYQVWQNHESGETLNTCSIVTTQANSIMTKIHNNPDVIKRTGSGRMPVILPNEIANQWIEHDEFENIEKQRVQDLIKPYPSDQLIYHTVSQLQGNNGTGNSPEASKKTEYNIIGLP